MLIESCPKEPSISSFYSEESCGSASISTYNAKDSCGLSSISSFEPIRETLGDVSISLHELELVRVFEPIEVMLVFQNFQGRCILKAKEVLHKSQGQQDKCIVQGTQTNSKSSKKNVIEEVV